MSRNFLLDENIVVRGLRQSPPAATELWLRIAQNCHRLIVSGSLAGKYWSKLREQSGEAAPETATLMARVMTLLLTNTEKSLWFDPEVLPSADRVVGDVDDWFLEDLAVTAAPECGHCDFVSVDVDTRGHFNHSKMLARDIRGLTIEEGLAEARLPCTEVAT